jgi:hypothetical protein
MFVHKSRQHANNLSLATQFPEVSMDDEWTSNPFSGKELAFSFGVAVLWVAATLFALQIFLTETPLG